MPLPSETGTEAESYFHDRAMPPAFVRITGRLGTRIIVGAPALWPLLRKPTVWIWGRMAERWDAGTRPDAPDHLAPLLAACDHIETAPQRVLEVGSGTGAGTLALAHRFRGAELFAVDISEAMVRKARAKLPPELSGRVHFAVGDAASLAFEKATFDLLTYLNMPPFVDEAARVLRVGGHVVIADSAGAWTPSHVPERTIRRALERRGLEVVATGQAAAGTFLVARKPT